MINKILLSGVKALKISLRFGVILFGLAVLVVGFFLAFPNLLKAPLETQLANATGFDVELSEIIFEFNEDGASLKVNNLTLNPIKSEQTLVRIEGLQWQLQLFNLLDDNYHPYQIYVDTLTVDTAAQAKSGDFSAEGMAQLIAKEMLGASYFLKSLVIKKTLIKGEQNFEIAPITINHNQGQLSLNVANQQIGKHQINASLTLLNEQSYQGDFIALSMVVGNEDFLLLSDLKLYQQNKQSYVELSGFIEKIKVTDLDDYMPASIVGEAANSWMKRGFKSGVLEKTRVRVLKNLSAEMPAEINFNTHLADTELAFSSNWESLKKLDADITSNGKNIEVAVNNAVLYNQPLTNISLEVADISRSNLEVRMLGNLDMDSAKFMQFLADAPSGDAIHQAVSQFSLAGPLQGKFDLLIPLDNRATTMDVDLVVKDNQLTALDGDMVIENYNSKIAFHNNQLSTEGVGSIRDILFDIQVNPSDRKNDEKTSFAVAFVNDDKALDLYLTHRENQVWHAEIKSKTVTTNVEVSTIDDLLNVKVLDLQVTSSDDVKSDWDIQPNDLPDMFLSVHNVVVDEQEMPDFSVKLESTSDILKITDLSFNGIGVSNHDLLFEGAWVDGKTNLIAKVKGKKLSEFLKKLKIKEKVSGGEFDLDLNLSCDCVPWNMSLKTLNGVVKMKTKEGVFIDEDLNIGRVLLLLNIKLIAKLDITDATEEGFAYDSIDAQITLQDSHIKINHFKLESSSGTINLSGTNNIIDKTHDMQAKIIPAIGDTLPVATYLAGGGLAGLSVWLINQSLFEGKLIDKIIDKVVEFKYKITGPWDEPIIENISTIL